CRGGKEVCVSISLHLLVYLGAVIVGTVNKLIFVESLCV
ncbi:MAG: hypothetical protein ACI9XJ_002082, partial [Marivirga sp.]